MAETRQLIQILANTLSQDKDVRSDAERVLEQLSQTNFPELMKALSEILAGENNPRPPRMAAGLQLKNGLTSIDEAVKVEYQMRWLSTPEETRNYIRRNVLSALGIESAAAQCLAYIVVAEFQKYQSLDLIQALFLNASPAQSSTKLRKASLECIGYIFSDIDPNCAASRSCYHTFVKSILDGMHVGEENDHVKLAATTALRDCLEFTRTSFEQEENERNCIMQAVFDAMESVNIEVKVAALQCLVKIMSLYYEYMSAYMPHLTTISLNAMKSGIDDIVFQGIKFWTSVCEEEYFLAVEAQEAVESENMAQRGLHHYTLGALKDILPVLLQLLTQEEETDDVANLIASKACAARVCLDLVVTCCGDSVVHTVWNFVQENIKSEDWRHRAAAIRAFESILDVVEPKKPIFEGALPYLVELTRDPCFAVRFAATETVSGIFESDPDVFNEGYILLLLEGLKKRPIEASKFCCTLGSLVGFVYSKALQESMEDNNVSTYLLSPFFSVIVDELLETTRRPDVDQGLLTEAYQALLQCIHYSAKDCYSDVERITKVILEKLCRMLRLELAIRDKYDSAQFVDHLMLLCVNLQSGIHKLKKEDALKISDAVMVALLDVLFCSMRQKSCGLQLEALVAVYSLVYVIGVDFVKYMGVFTNILCASLKNVNQGAVCLAAVVVIRSVCRALGHGLVIFHNEILTRLVKSLKKPSSFWHSMVDRRVKPEFLSAVGDIVKAVAPYCTVNFEDVLMAVHQVSIEDSDRSEYCNVEYLNDLRKGCLEAYNSIVQSAAHAHNTLQVRPHVVRIVEYTRVVAEDSVVRPESVSSAAARLIGNLCAVFGQPVGVLLDSDLVRKLLRECRHSRTSEVKEVGEWATKELKHKTYVRDI